MKHLAGKFVDEEDYTVTRPPMFSYLKKGSGIHLSLDREAAEMLKSRWESSQTIYIFIVKLLI